MVRDARQRRVAAVLHAADERAHLLEVFPRLLPPSAPQLVRVCRFGEDVFEQFRRRDPIRGGDPSRDLDPCVREHGAIVVGQGLEPNGRLDVGQRGGEPRCQDRERRIGHPHEARSEKRRRAKIRRGPRQEPNQRRDVLDLVRVEKAQTLVDVRRDPAQLQLAFELAMARARSEQDGDVARSRGARHARLPIAHGLVAKDPRDFLGDGGGAGQRIIRGLNAEHHATGCSRAGHRRLGLRAIEREPIAVVEAKVIGATRRRPQLGADFVDERQQRRDGAKAPGDRPLRAAPRPQSFDVAACFLKQRDVRVAEAIDGLLAIADDED